MPSTPSMIKPLTFTLAILAADPGLASSVYLTPAGNASTGGEAKVQVSPAFTGDLDFDLYMDFDAADPTLGGGIDFRLSGPLALLDFTPSSYFNSTPDVAFTGSGRAQADHDYEVHFGHFNGLAGVNLLGTLTVSLTQALDPVTNPSAAVDLLINSLYGDFYSAVSFDKQVVSLSGATILAVPEPEMVWTMLSGLGLLGLVFRRAGAKSHR